MNPGGVYWGLARGWMGAKVTPVLLLPQTCVGNGETDTRNPVWLSNSFAIALATAILDQNLSFQAEADGSSHPCRHSVEEAFGFLRWHPFPVLCLLTRAVKMNLPHRDALSIW